MALVDAINVRDIVRRIANNKDYGWSVASSYVQILINIVVQIVLIPLYLQYLGKVQFGVLMIVLASVNYLGLGIGWASAGAQRIMGEKYTLGEAETLQRVFGLSKIIFFLYAGLTAVGGFGVVWGTGDLWFGDDVSLRQDVIDMLLIGIVYMVVLYDLNVDRLILIAIGKQAYANALTAISLVVFAIAVVPILGANGGLPGVMVANLIGVVIARGVAYAMLRRFDLRARLPNRNDLGILRRLVGSMGLGYALYGALLLTLLQADTILLGILGGATLVADYVLIWKVADVAMQALWRLPESLAPYLVHMDAKGENDRLRSIYITARKAMFLLAGVAGLAYAALGQKVVELWVGTENVPDAPWAYVLAGGALFWMVIARLPTIFAFSMVKLSPLVSATALEVGLKITLMIVLFPALGLYSPLVAINVIHILGLAFLYQSLTAKCGLGLPDEER